MEQYVQVAFTVQSKESLELNSAFEIIAAILHEEEFESFEFLDDKLIGYIKDCLLYTSPSPRDPL